MVTKRIGKGTTIDFQPCSETVPGTVDTDLSDSGPWVNLGCTFDVQPPSCQWDSITGEQCLEDTDQPASELGDIQEDNPSFTPPFDPGDSEYQLLEDFCSSNECIAFRYTYAGGARHYFYGRIKSLVPDNIERNTFMRAPITIMRTSLVYRAFGDVPTGTNFSCTSCREVA